MKETSWTVIVGDSDTDHNERLHFLLAETGIRLIECTTADEVEQALATSTGLLFAFFSLELLADNKYSLLSHQALQNIDTAVIHHTDDPTAVSQSINAGATYFFSKPLNPAYTREIIEDALSTQRLKARRKQIEQARPLDQFGQLRGSSRPMFQLYRQLRKVAQTETAVLLEGESGTGKELAAKTIHQFSARRDKPFVAINCGAIPPELIESELFGHEKGSFSGAERKRIGYFEQARGGTLFLDEIGEMSMDLQVKFLRVLESGEFRPVGSERVFYADVRLITATNRNSQNAIKNGLMREDLYFRIAQFPVRMPPLRERGQDIVGLAQHFLNQQNLRHNTHKTLAPQLHDQLAGYAWPGNVRELRSAIERAFLLADHSLEYEHFPQLDEEAAIINSEGVLRLSVGSSLQEAERKLIFATLEHMDGDKKKTAMELGISVKTLYNKLKQYEV